MLPHGRADEDVMNANVEVMDADEDAMDLVCDSANALNGPGKESKFET